MTFEDLTWTQIDSIGRFKRFNDRNKLQTHKTWVSARKWNPQPASIRGFERLDSDRKTISWKTFL